MQHKITKKFLSYLKQVCSLIFFKRRPPFQRKESFESNYQAPFGYHSKAVEGLPLGQNSSRTLIEELCLKCRKYRFLCCED